MSRGKRRSHGVRHVLLALLLVSPPSVRLAVDFLRGPAGVDAGAPEEAAHARVEREALREERPRRKTKPSKGAKARRLDSKKKRSEVKRTRGRVNPDD